MITGQTPDLQMTPEEFTMIRDFIHERSGIFFAENKMYLVKNRLQKRMEQLDIKSVRDYFYHVKYDLSLKEFNILMDLVTTNETSFYRNEPQLLSFSEEALPLIVKDKTAEGSRSIRIWSAGCSSGEEPYTLAIMIKEKPLLAGWNVEIFASDISEEILQKARHGEYQGLTLRNVPSYLLAKHFTKSGESYRVNPEVKALVKYSQLNLNDQRKVSFMNNMDAIFCRNVMIYFSDEVKKQLVRGFFNNLRPGGYLYIGHSETLHGISKAFKLVYFKNALVYQKEASESAATKSGAVSTARTAAAPRGEGGGASRALDLLSKIKQPAAAGK
ncbi:MAG: protein-glutamate O-methyltransferase CheR [candidate division Zixibacteria bacterium]|jgi:chemotaxis protein methyltransferase CheR|nr:protein-glutamate O-methyltransferase CheR [candidate division Zixibacteria bacterium]